MNIKLENKFDLWVNNTHKSINDIKNILSSEKDYDKEFVELAQFILTNEYNPYGYMPMGWCNCLYSAQMTESFLCVLHHAMVDDGDLCWIDTEIHGPFLAFESRHDFERIRDLVETRFMNVLPVTYTVYKYTSDFIRTLVEFEEAQKQKYEKLNRRAGII